MAGRVGLAAALQACTPPHFIIVADLRPEFVVLAPSRDVIEPQATLLRFPAARQSREMKVDFVHQFLRQIGRAKRMRIGIMGVRRVQHNRRADPETTNSTSVARSWRKNRQLIHSTSLVTRRSLGPRGTGFLPVRPPDGLETYPFKQVETLSHCFLPTGRTDGHIFRPVKRDVGTKHRQPIPAGVRHSSLKKEQPFQ